MSFSQVRVVRPTWRPAPGQGPRQSAATPRMFRWEAVVTGSGDQVRPDDTPAHSEAVRMAGEQGLLFTEEDGMPTPPSEDVGYRGPTACAAAGITYRQLDYWARTGLVQPSIRPAAGSDRKSTRLNSSHVKIS